MRHFLAALLTGGLVALAGGLSAQKIGDAILLNGTTGYANAGGITDLAFGGSAPFSVEAWVNPTDGNRIRIIAAKFNLGVRGSWQFSLNAGNTVSFDRASAASTIRGNKTVSSNTFSHIAATYDGTTARIYVNSVLDVTAASGSQTTDTSTPVTIGCRLGSGVPRDFFKGGLDEVRIWNYARSQAEIQADFGKPLKGNETGLVAYWRCDTIEDLGVGASGTNDLRDAIAGTHNADAIGGVAPLWRTRDWDRDGVANTLEATASTDPYLKDTDSDGVEDGVERALGFNPLSASEPVATTDSDNDLLPDANDTAPANADRDHDGHPDGLEVALGTDPDSAASSPTVGDYDGDGHADFPDAVQLMSLALAKLTWPQNTEDRATDLDRDGRPTAVDAVILFNYYLGNLPMLYSAP